MLQQLLHRLRANTIILLVILGLFTFLRFYQLDERLPLGWDQIQNSWMMKNMIVDHKLPLEGMVAKGNSGFYIGPAYYYLMAPFYYVLQLDPIAAGLFAGVVSLVTFIVLYLVTRKIFSKPVALVAVSIYTVSAATMSADRVAWPVIFIPSTSLLIFYFLYQVIIGKTHYLLWLATLLGFSFHVHFTSIFYLIIVLLTLPFFFKRKDTWKYGLLALPIFAVWFIPNVLVGHANSFSAANNLADYLQTYYHGFHFVRLAQLLRDAFIQFELLIFFKVLKSFAGLLFPVFLFSYYKEKPTRDRLILCCLFLLWFIVPWIVFSVYSGEVSDYYFTLTRLLAIIILAYLTWRLIQSKLVLIRPFVIGFWIYYAVVNIQAFNKDKHVILPKARDLVGHAMRENKIIDFLNIEPSSYLYYVETLKGKK